MSLANSTSLKKTSSSGTTDSPYLGSKISLVSKAKIRYEGILYTIDANESTVALSNVRSFGTEERPTDRPVPARDEIFEYIIFRGADIEDLQVREPPQSSLTQDPAIVESSTYPDSNRANTIGTNTNLAGLSHNGQTRSSSNRGTMPSPPHYQGAGKGLKPFDPLRQLNFNQQRSTRPYGQQSPLTQFDGQDFSYGNQRRGRQQQDYSYDNQRRDRQQQDYSYGNQRRDRQQQDYYNDYSMNRRGNQNYGYTEWPRQSQRYSRQVQNYNDNRFYPSRRQQSTGGYYGYRQRRNSTGGITNNQQQTRNNRQQQQQRERSDDNTTTNNRSILKFTGDFDFEKSNAEFDKNAIEDEIKKSLSIKPTKDSPTAEHEKENQQTYSSSTQSELQDMNTDGYYDKQKSFFDRISCESNEKEKTNPRRN